MGSKGNPRRPLQLIGNGMRPGDSLCKQAGEEPDDVIDEGGFRLPDRYLHPDGDGLCFLHGDHAQGAGGGSDILQVVAGGVLLGHEDADTASVDLSQVDIAFYGEYKELTEEDKETVRDMVRLMRERRAAKQRN